MTKQSPKRNFHRQPGLFDTQDEIFWHWDLVFGSTHVTEKARVSRVREKIHEKNNREARFDLPTPIPRMVVNALHSQTDDREKKVSSKRRPHWPHRAWPSETSRPTPPSHAHRTNSPTPAHVRATRLETHSTRPPRFPARELGGTRESTRRVHRPRRRFSRQDEERPRRHRDDVDERAVPARGHRRDHHSEDRRGLRRRQGVVEDGHVGERGGSRVPRREHRVRSQGGRGQGGDATRSGARAQVQARRNGGERVHGRAREPREGRRALLGRAGRRRHRVTWVGASDARAEKGG